MVVRDGLTDDDRAEVDALVSLMARRGPDDQGAWDDGRACALGFRRLSIIDLSDAGHQPMATEDGRHVLVFNGELYNYRELRAELEAAGRRFRSESDTEVVLQSLVHWGLDGLARFDAMFALAWYRPGQQALVLARDAVGIKPLAWWWSPEAFVFGSQYDQVIRHRRCRRDLDAGALGLYLRLGHVPAPYGVVTGTGQVEPGQWMLVRPGEAPATGRFRERPKAPPAEDRLCGRDAVDAVAEAVERSVAHQMVADVPVGVYLSGGVDSPLVTASARRASPGRLEAFSIGTDDPASDESAAAAAYAEVLGVDQRLRTIRGDDALAMLDDVTRAYSEPFGDYSSFPTLMVSELAAGSVKAVLSGDGGDELFWGYPRFAKVRAARRWFALPRAVRAAAYGVTKPLPVRRRPARGVLFPTLGDWYLDAHSGLRARDLDSFAPELDTLPGGYDAFELRGVSTDDGLLQWMRANELGTHLPMVLHKVDRASMYHGLEVRVPLLDWELVELAHRVDPSAALDETTGKVVLRAALARHVPPSLIPTPKKGFTVPMRRWLRDDLGPVFRDRLLAGQTVLGDALDRRALARWYEGHVDGTFDRTRGLWNLLALQLWADTHLAPLDRCR